MLNSRDEMRRLKAIRESPSNKRKEELARRIEAERRRRSEEKKQEQEAFRLWEEADNDVRTLEEIRDLYAPKDMYEEWDPMFKKAMRLLPEAKDRARTLWLDYICEKWKGGD